MSFPVAGRDLDSFPGGTGRQLPIGAAGLPPGTLLAAVGTLLQFPALAFSLGCCQVRPAALAIHSPAQMPTPLLVLGPGSETEGSAYTKRSLHGVLGSYGGFGTSGVWDGEVGTGRDSTAFRQAPGRLATHLHGRELGGRVMSSGNFGSSRERFDKCQQHVRCR